MNKNEDAIYFYATGFSILLNVLMTWFMVAFGFELVITHLTYPLSDLVLIVFDPIVPIIFIAWLLIILSNPIGICVTIQSFYPKVEILNKVITTTGKVLTIVFVTGLIALVLNFFAWPQVAKAQGYVKCPAATLLIDETFNSVWVKNSKTCHNTRIKMQLKNSMHENVIAANHHIKTL